MSQTKDQVKSEIPSEDFQSYAILGMFSEDIQKAIIDVVAGKTYARSTDIWYRDENTATVVVLRRGVQWFLNDTAGQIWENLGVPTKVIIEKLKEMYDFDEAGIAKYCVDFLLQSENAGLVEEMSKRPREKRETKG